MADLVRHKDLEFYLARANQARAEADSTTLEKVRERCLRSEAAWMEMAAKVQLTQSMRRTLQAAKANPSS